MKLQLFALVFCFGSALINLECISAKKYGTYLGCFKDQEPRDLTGTSTTFANDNGINKCMNYCKSKDFLYAGLQFGIYCYCGNSYGKWGETSNDCVKNCKQGGRKCGGMLRNSVYFTGVKHERYGDYFGCYKDKYSRDLTGTSATFAKDNAIKKCTNYCKSKKFRYAGLQFGIYCYCGNSYGKWGERPYKECDKNCKRGAGKCGGMFRNSVYATGVKRVTKQRKVTTLTECVDPYTNRSHKLNSRWVSKQQDFCFHYHCVPTAGGPTRVDCLSKDGKCIQATKSGKPFDCKHGKAKCSCLSEKGHTYVQHQV